MRQTASKCSRQHKEKKTPLGTKCGPTHRQIEFCVVKNFQSHIAVSDLRLYSSEAKRRPISPEEQNVMVGQGWLLVVV